MKTYNIAALAGDGIGNEVMREAIKVLRATEKKFGFQAQHHRSARRLGRH